MNPRWLAALVLVLAAYLCFGSLGARSLENRDITRTAEIARETLDQGRWLAPTREGEVETEKPPFYIWLVAGLGAVTGRVGAIESRLPAAAGSFAAALLLYLWLARRREALVAAVAAAFLAGGQIFLELARISRVDAVFAFFLAVSVLAAFEAERRKLGPKLLLSAVSGVALAGAMLTKSPLLGMVLHLASVGGWYIVDLAVEKPWRELREPPALTILRRFLAPPASLPPILACVLFGAWFFPFKASLSPVEWAAVKHQFVFENTQRAITGSDKPKPPWFYVPIVLFRAAPGALFALLFGAAKHEDAEDRRLHRFVQSWWFFPFLVLSIATGKDSRYILPALPGLAAAGALNWKALAGEDAPWTRLVGRSLGWIVFGLGGVATPALPVAAALKLPEALGDACWLAALCGVAAWLGFRAATAAERSLAAALAPLLLAVFVGEAAWNVILLPTPPIERSRVWVKHIADALPRELDLQDLVLYQKPKQGEAGETRQRRTRILLSIYRDEPALPLVVGTPEQLLQELAVSEKRRALVDSTNWADLAPIASQLVVAHDFTVSVDKGQERTEERFRVVRRAR